MLSNPSHGPLSSRVLELHSFPRRSTEHVTNSIYNSLNLRINWQKKRIQLTWWTVWPASSRYGPPLPPNPAVSRPPVPPAQVFPPTWGFPVSSILPCFGPETSSPLSRSTVNCRWPSVPFKWTKSYFNTEISRKKWILAVIFYFNLFVFSSPSTGLEYHVLRAHVLKHLSCRHCTDRNQKRYSQLQRDHRNGTPVKVLET